MLIKLIKCNEIWTEIKLGMKKILNQANCHENEFDKKINKTRWKTTSI